MAAAPRPWTVLPHQAIERLEENLWSVEGKLPSGGMTRRMAIFRLGDGRLVFYNAIPLDDASMAAVEAWGTPAFLVIPSSGHRLDVHAFAARYPGLKVVCQKEIAAKVGQVVRVDGAFDLLPADPRLEIVWVDGTKHGETVFVSTSPDGARVSYVFADVVTNIPRQPGVEGLLFRLLGATGEPSVHLLSRIMVVKDKRAVADHLRRLAARPGVERLIPSHGANVTNGAAARLKACADALA